MVPDVKLLRNDTCAQRAATVGQFLQTCGVAALQDQGFGAGAGVFQRKRAADASGCAGDQNAARKTGLLAIGGVHVWGTELARWPMEVR
ncbi:hypothetical protein D3C87_1978590 [compost metagenome]